MVNKSYSIPWDEIFDRLYHRQESEAIVDDLIKRGRVDEEERIGVASLIESLKQKMELLRLGK